MIIHLTRKDTGQVASINAAHVVTYNADIDGEGTMVVLSGDVARPVKEDFHCVDKQVKKALDCSIFG
jgi:hypothetical protein